ncbi:disease resistance protein RGA2 [Musa acuminata AAA Group]|uniref:disease resistance protein RGA2 n=1 Tax=Musa acuminata AAA Group TaxID=214697 RepID=UPI0031DA606F
MAMVVEAFVSRLLNALGDLAMEEADALLGVPGEIQRLQRTLRTIRHVLRDAERRRIEDEAIDDWLRELKDAMYDADDILDECQVQAEKKPTARAGARKRRRFSWFSGFGRQVELTHEIGVRIRDLNRRLEEISARRTAFDLRVYSDRKPTSRVSRKTSPVLESDIVGTGMEEDARDLVELLTKEDTRSNVLVLAVVGIGGIGKTTLAQKVFHDDRTKASFRRSMWVCVSQEFVESDVLRDIIAGAGGSDGGARSRALLEPVVESLLRGNKFLLVLDDVWSEYIWEDLLRNPLQGGAAGSRVLVTTRNEGIARRMKAVHIHRMKLLPLHDGWSLLCKKVAHGDDEERDARSIADIGLKIVEKCDGLPLAIKTIGGVLCTKGLSRRAWEQVLRSAAWSQTGLPEGVKGALYLSYEDLPSQLKQCFLYCAMFPEDYIHLRQYLIQFWIAEGFVQAAGDLTPEAAGEEYYRELIRRSLLQPHPMYHDQFGCTMHDLLRSLAHFLTRDESLFVKDVQQGWKSAASAKLRRVSVIAPGTQRIQPILDAIKKQESVRTLLLERTSVSETDVDDHLRKLTRLRVLHLADTRILGLPQHIGELIHLRYLDLSDCHIRELPESIGNLVNLQYLILNRSRISNLPKSVVKLHNLRSLDLECVPVEGFPSGIGRLQHLNVLRGLVVNTGREWCSLEEVSNLRRLRWLAISKLERAWAAAEPGEAAAKGLRNNQDLEWVEMHCSPCRADTAPPSFGYAEEEMERIERVFDTALHPPSSLDKLEIQHFFGRRYPTWLTTASVGLLLGNLRRLVLVDCRLCPWLPPLGKLPNLEFLRIRGASAVVAIGSEFLGCEAAGGKRRSSSPVSFPKLTELWFDGMINWEEWHWGVIGDDEVAVAMPRLSHLHLVDCPRLRDLPEALSRHATALTRLQTKGVGSLKSICGFSSMKRMQIHDESGLESVSDLPALEFLEVSNNKMSYLPKWLVTGLQAQFTALQRLDIEGSSQLLRSCLQNGEEWPRLSHVPIVYIQDDQHKYICYIKSSSTAYTNLKEHSDDRGKMVNEDQEQDMDDNHGNEAGEARLDSLMAPIPQDRRAARKPPWANLCLCSE